MYILLEDEHSNFEKPYTIGVAVDQIVLEGDNDDLPTDILSTATTAIRAG